MRYPRSPIVWLIVASIIVIGHPAVANQLTDYFRHDTRGQGMAAVALARRALEYSCRTHELLPVPKELPPLLRRRGAAFVSTMLYRNGAPRCCMGSLTPAMPTLAEEIINLSYLAATRDKRFPPLQPKELKSFRVIVSIIGESTPIVDLSTLDPLTDGLAAHGPRETGIVLPGETGDIQKVIAWARTRAGATTRGPVEYFRLVAVRFIEPIPTKEVSHAPH